MMDSAISHMNPHPSSAVSVPQKLDYLIDKSRMAQPRQNLTSAVSGIEGTSPWAKCGNTTTNG